MSSEKKEKKAPEKEIKGIVRLFGTDLNGHKKVVDALRSIKGVSFTFAKAVLKRSGVENVEIGTLPDSDVKKLEDVIRNPGNYGIPDYLLNRRKDPVTGENYHLVASDLHMKVREDINRLKKLGNYRGIRHRRGLPVRGQRTRSSFRKGKSVGVSKKRR